MRTKSNVGGGGGGGDKDISDEEPSSPFPLICVALVSKELLLAKLPPLPPRQVDEFEWEIWSTADTGCVIYDGWREMRKL